jgi:uncharacterized protein
MLPTTLFGIILALSEVRDSESLRFVYSSEQGADTSCGLSTLSCLMNTYWGCTTDETSLALELFSTGKEENFTTSFADMIRLLRAHGFACQAYNMTFTQLGQAVAKYAPVIIHYGKPEGHFALVLAMSDSTLVTADPAQGTVAQERGAFESAWSGYVLLAALPKQKPKREIVAAAVESVLGREELLDRAAIVATGGSGW